MRIDFQHLVGVLQGLAPVVTIVEIQLGQRQPGRHVILPEFHRFLELRPGLLDVTQHHLRPSQVETQHRISRHAGDHRLQLLDGDLHLLGVAGLDQQRGAHGLGLIVGGIVLQHRIQDFDRLRQPALGHQHFRY